MDVSDQLLSKRCNDVLGQSIRERLSACGGDFIGKRFSHFGEHGDNTLLVDPAGASEIRPGASRAYRSMSLGRAEPNNARSAEMATIP